MADKDRLKELFPDETISFEKGTRKSTKERILTCPQFPDILKRAEGNSYEVIHCTNPRCNVRAIFYPPIASIKVRGRCSED